MMRKVAENYAMHAYDPGYTLDGASDDGLLGRIGDDLRDLYSEMTDAEQPQALRALAEAVEARIASLAPGE